MTTSGRIRYLIALGVALLLIVLAVSLLGPRGRPIDLVIRSTAMLGFSGVFLATLSSIYMRELARFFGTPFIKLHHYIAVTSLALLTVHALGVAIDRGTLAVFVPDFSSWFNFLAFGGRPAWYLLVIAALVALASVRKRLPRGWRIIHMLNYVVFGLGAAHAWLIGANFRGVAGRAVLAVMAAIVVLAFIQKRRQMARRAARRVD
jgi:DMSO/TMAO reductase YedYZ heme-binding membrane subunit